MLHEFDNKFFNQGYRFIAGIDEAGRGPLAGPVVASAVILPPNISINGVDDSK
ncbi:MAG TPA: ribonuclease HII, partial [Nitrospinota bacterium]|nr:ribonuclease HII [Nitrospinota bacterium]